MLAPPPILIGAVTLAPVPMLIAPPFPPVALVPVQRFNTPVVCELPSDKSPTAGLVALLIVLFVQSIFPA